jgi:hypothetical protein
MNVLNGFTTGFSFFFAAPFFPGIVNVYDGPNGTGNVASLNLATNTNGCGGARWRLQLLDCFGVPFAGTAFSVNFGGTASHRLRDITPVATSGHDGHAGDGRRGRPRNRRRSSSSDRLWPPWASSA